MPKYSYDFYDATSLFFVLIQYLVYRKKIMIKRIIYCERNKNNTVLHREKKQKKKKASLKVLAISGVNCIRRIE